MNYTMRYALALLIAASSLQAIQQPICCPVKQQCTVADIQEMNAAFDTTIKSVFEETVVASTVFSNYCRNRIFETINQRTPACLIITDEFVKEKDCEQGSQFKQVLNKQAEKLAQLDRYQAIPGFQEQVRQLYGALFPETFPYDGKTHNRYGTIKDIDALDTLCKFPVDNEEKVDSSCFIGLCVSLAAFSYLYRPPTDNTEAGSLNLLNLLRALGFGTLIGMVHYHTMPASYSEWANDQALMASSTINRNIRAYVEETIISVLKALQALADK